MNKKFFELRAGRLRPRCAIFMSGSGSNAKVLLNLSANSQSEEYEIAAIVTDNPEKSRAEELAERFNVPMIGVSIREYYHEHGEKRVSLATERGRELRRKWTALLIGKLREFDLDFGIFAGFVPLCDISDVMPCLNVHPGDLLIKDESGSRVLTGLHTVPVEKAILRGLATMRSSVMVVQPLDEEAKNVDAGPILGVSAPVAIDFKEYNVEELRAIAALRPAVRPVGGFKDVLEELAAYNQERLKYAGDHVVLPQCARHFAAGCYALNSAGELVFTENNRTQVVETIEFSPDGSMEML